MYILPEGVQPELINIDLWKGKDGKLFNDKSLAEYTLAIARKCEKCGKPTEGMSYILCPSCTSVKKRERYEELQEIEWDGETPLCLFQDDTYFFHLDEIQDYCDENEIEDIQELMLVLCEPNKPRAFSIYDLLDDVLPEDTGADEYSGALELEDKVNEWLNSHIFSWVESNKRVAIKELY